MGLLRTSASPTACGYQSLLVHPVSVYPLMFMTHNSLPITSFYLFLSNFGTENLLKHTLLLIAVLPLRAFPCHLLTATAFPVVLRTNQYLSPPWTTARLQRV